MSKPSREEIAEISYARDLFRVFCGGWAAQVDPYSGFPKPGSPFTVTESRVTRVLKRRRLALCGGRR